jgi:hypothetical protein
METPPNTTGDLEALRQVFGKPNNRLTDLRGQLTRGHQDERAHRPVLAAFGCRRIDELLQQRQRKRRRLARTRLRRAQHVAPFKNGGDGGGLDGGGGDVALFLHGAQECGQQCGRKAQ